LSKKQKEASMVSFLKDDKSIASVKGLIYGFDLESEAERLGLEHKDVYLAISASYNSSGIIGEQSRGRVSRTDLANREKISKTYYLYVEDFKLGNDTFRSQEKVWLLKLLLGKKYQMKNL
jgi:hypothetical protein